MNRNMKIVIMMRAMDQDSGFRGYVENLVEKLLEVASDDEFLLFYRTDKWFGRFAHFPNAHEILLRPKTKLLWDQIAVPIQAWREGAHVIFNPKFSIPLISHCPVAMGLQEPAWWVWPEHYEKLDVWYQKIMLPLYCRKAKHIFPMSFFNLNETRKYIRLPFANTTISYPAVGKQFKKIHDKKELELFREKYNLPKQFILSVTRVDHPGLERSTSFHAGKNVDTTVRAFSIIKDKIPHKLIIAGRNVAKYLKHAGYSDKDLEGVTCLGFIPANDMPKLYNTADLFVIPSYYEGFGFTLLEAMACGCPAVASQMGACAEVSSGASLLADPHNPTDFAEKIRLVLTDHNLRSSLKIKSLKRAGDFSWKQTAINILAGFSKALNEQQTDVQ